MINSITKYWYVVVIALIVGFFVGRAWQTNSIKTEYVKGETIHDSINIPKPCKIEIPAKQLLPIKPDTFYVDSVRYITLKVDTAKIISEYINRKTYKPILFDDKENGKLSLGLVVQYNKLDSIGYEFTPVRKETTITKERIFTPFINASYNSFGYIGVGGGLYYKNIGVGAKYITDFKNKGLEISGHIKF